MAIRFRGILEDLSQLEEGACPPGAVMLDEGGDMDEVLSTALRQSVPMLVTMLALSVVRLTKGLDWAQGTSVGQVFLGVLASGVLYVLLIVAHEWLHALCLPRRAKKDIWFYEAQAALVYCNAPMSRQRFLVMSALPTVLLGFLPFVLWMLTAQRVAPVVAIFWMLLCWAMIFGGIGDFYNIRNVRAQVPKDAVVFNYGLHTYWMKKH